MTANTSTESHLLALPAELRLQIYSHIFSIQPDSVAEDGDTSEYSQTSIGTDFTAGEVIVEVSHIITSRRKDKGGRGAGRNFAAILQTCRQIHAEAVDILHEQTLFRIALGAAGAEMVDNAGRLRLRSPWPQANASEEGTGIPLRDLSLFDRMQNVHLELNIGRQTNPIWDVIPVTCAILTTLNRDRKTTTASLRFGLMVAVNCVRLHEPWIKFVQEVKTVELGCMPDIEVDHDVEKWAKHGRKRFEDLAAVMGGELRFVKFKERLGPHDHNLRACVIL